MPGSTNLGEVWTRYWASGHSESFAVEQGGFDATGYWRDFFSTFADGARLLDLATGGASVIRAALACAGGAGRAFEIHGVDLADLGPVERALGATQIGTVRLHGNTDLKALPFADGYFDGVTSQFGIEYAERKSAAREVVRVLKPGGRGLFLLHHSESAIARQTAARLAAHRRIFPDDMPFRLGEQLFARYAGRAPRMTAGNERERFRAAVQALARRLPPDPLLSNTAEVVSYLVDLARTPEIYVPEDALRRLAIVERDIAAWAMRQKALLDSALDAAGVETLRAALRAAGTEVREAELFKHPSGSLLAWSLGLQKPA
ncbi:MAG: class I SAM-dependent methyltransferase [Alphaproteobacteria bacterium]